MKQEYRYTECGLDNVIIEGVDVVKVDDVDDGEGDELYCIPNINGLHEAITLAIITQDTGISPKELRFLRTGIGITQQQLAEILKVSRGTINRWESGKEHLDPNAEFLLRQLTAEKLKLDLNKSVEEIARSCVWKVEKRPIRIDGSNPENYRPLAA